MSELIPSLTPPQLHQHHRLHSATTTVLRPSFRDHLGEPAPEENFWTLLCKRRLTDADTPTIWLGATPSGLTSAHRHHPLTLSNQVRNKMNQACSKVLTIKNNSAEHIEILHCRCHTHLASEGFCIIAQPCPCYC